MWLLLLLLVLVFVFIAASRVVGDSLAAVKYGDAAIAAADG